MNVELVKIDIFSNIVPNYLENLAEAKNLEQAYIITNELINNLNSLFASVEDISEKQI